MATTCPPIRPGNEAPRPEAEASRRPPEGADHVRLPPLGAGKAENTIGDTTPRPPPWASRAFPRLQDVIPPGTGDDCGRRHAGSLEAIRVARPEAVVS